MIIVINCNNNLYYLMSRWQSLAMKNRAKEDNAQKKVDRIASVHFLKLNRKTKQQEALSSLLKFCLYQLLIHS